MSQRWKSTTGKMKEGRVVMNNSNHLDIATKLFKLGYGVIPLRDDKRPIGAWKELQTTPKSPNDMIKSNSYGLICGVNNVEVLDLDYKVLPSEEDKDGHYNTMLSFIQENIEDAANKLALYETMSGGVHIIYKTKKKEGNQVLSKLKDERTLYETRGVGGYAFFYPDKNVFGRNYETLEYITDSERSLLFSFFKSFDEREDVIQKTERSYTTSLSHSSLDIINRFNRETSILDIVGDEFKVVGKTLKGTSILRNGDTKSKTSGTIFEDSGAMYLFSTSTQYPAETFISPFTAHMVKNHGNDFKSALNYLINKAPSTVLQCASKVSQYKSQLSEQEIRTLAFEMKNSSLNIDSFKETCSHLSLDDYTLSKYWYSDLDVSEDAKVVIYELNEKLTPKDSFDLKSFHDLPKNYAAYRDYIGSSLAVVSICEVAVKKNLDGTLDFSKKKNLSDLFLDLKDAGMKISESEFRRIMDSDRVEKLEPLTILYHQLRLTPWDGVDRIPDIVQSASLTGDFNNNLYLLNKFFCTVYGFAFRGIDPLIPKECYSRVIAIIVNEAKGTGKSTFWKKLGMSGSVKEATGISGAEFYSETQGELPKDERQFKIEQISNMLYQFDDLTDVMIKATGAFRSLISSTDISIRELYQSKTQNLPRRVTFCGSSNHMELIRDKTENRYMPFLQKGSVDVELFNSIDKFQFWAQIRDQIIKEQDGVYFNAEDLLLINQQAQSFVYQSPLEDSLSAILKYDPSGRETFSSIKRSVEGQGHRNVSDTLLGNALKKMVPDGEKLKKRSGSKQLYCFSYLKGHEPFRSNWY